MDFNQLPWTKFLSLMIWPIQILTITSNSRADSAPPGAIDGHTLVSGPKAFGDD